jgi:hypothetical protein
MIFLKRLLWSAVTNLFAAWILVDMILWSDIENVGGGGAAGLNTTYDFIIGEYSI